MTLQLIWQWFLLRGALSLVLCIHLMHTCFGACQHQSLHSWVVCLVPHPCRLHTVLWLAHLVLLNIIFTERLTPTIGNSWTPGIHTCLHEHLMWTLTRDIAVQLGSIKKRRWWVSSLFCLHYMGSYTIFTLEINGMCETCPLTMTLHHCCSFIRMPEAYWILSLDIFSYTSLQICSMVHVVRPQLSFHILPLLPSSSAVQIHTQS